jgi:hypothetical protein
VGGCIVAFVCCYVLAHTRRLKLQVLPSTSRALDGLNQATYKNGFLG